MTREDRTSVTPLMLPLAPQPLLHDCIDQVVFLEGTTLRFYGPDSLPAGGRIYKPVRNSNRHTTAVSWPGWKEKSE